VPTPVPTPVPRIRQHHRVGPHSGAPQSLLSIARLPALLSLPCSSVSTRVLLDAQPTSPSDVALLAKDLRARGLRSNALKRLKICQLEIHKASARLVTRQPITVAVELTIEGM
jgi:hypothetical protein